MWILNFIRKVYEKRLERKLTSGKIPKHIMIVADEDFVNKGLDVFLSWCKRFDIREITVCFRGKKRVVASKTVDGIRVNVIGGYSGRDEITDAVREMARLVERGELDPEEIDESCVEKFLKVRSSPDLIVKAGKEIPEFLIWQSIYSELYFIDMDWRNFRYVDFLRCLREYQRRERRYGR